MRLSIVPAAGLSAGQLAAVTARIDAAEHRHDRGACLFWHRDGALAKCYVALLPETGTPVGIAYVDGGSAHVRAAWWLDSRYRGTGMGSQLVDSLATVLKDRGCTGVGRIAIDTFAGEYDAASAALASRFTSHFS